MTTELRRFSPPITVDRLIGVLVDPDSEPTIPIDGSLKVDFTEPLELTRQMVEGGVEFPAWDAEIAIALHKALSAQPRRVLLDMGIWHWLATTAFREYVLARWCGGVIPTADTVLTSAEELHFLGRPTLNGVSRNAIARLYWGAASLYDVSDGYALVQTVFASQDFVTGLQERRFCLYPPAARACARELGGLGEGEIRAALRKLNYLASTITLELLSEDEIVGLLEPERH